MSSIIFIEWRVNGSEALDHKVYEILNMSNMGTHVWNKQEIRLMNLSWLQAVIN